MTFSIVIPVLNEGQRVLSVIDHVESITKDRDVEIIVVDGDENSSTTRLVARPGVIKLMSPRGRAIQMNRGAREAKGDIIIFLHSDTSLPERGLEKIEDTMSTGLYVGGAFELGINNPGRSFRVIERFAALRYRRTKIPFGDQAIFINRKYFENLGGYKEIPLMEDVELMRRIKKRGDDIYIIPEKAKSSARNWVRDGLIYTTFRNWTCQVLYSIGVSPEVLVRLYYPHWNAGKECGK